MAASTPGGARESSSASAARPAVVLAALLLLYVSNQWARSLPSYLVSFERIGSAGATARELLNVAIGFDAQQYGLLVSYGFSLLYVAFSFPAGIASDRFSRKKILLLSALGWSLATAGSAGCSTFAQLLAARVLLGVSQAFMSPAAYTILSDVFPLRNRATANAVYACGIYLGGALASLSVALSRAFGWRMTALAVAASSVPPALLLCLTLREQQPPQQPPPPPPPPQQLPAPAPGTGRGAKEVTPGAPPGRLSVVFGVRSVRLLLAATAARFFAGFAIGAWLAPFYRGAFPARSRLFSILNALIISVAGSLSVVAGGIASDVATGGGSHPHRAALVPTVGSLVAIPFWLGAMHAPNFFVSMGCLLCAYLAAECWYGATTAMVQSALPRAVWGTGQGMINAVQIAGNASPVIIGTLVRRGAPLRTLLSFVVPGAYAVCAALFWLASRARRDEASAESGEAT